MLGKQAKTLRAKDVERALHHAKTFTYPERNVAHWFRKVYKALGLEGCLQSFRPSDLHYQCCQKS